MLSRMEGVRDAQQVVGDVQVHSPSTPFLWVLDTHTHQSCLFGGALNDDNVCTQPCFLRLSAWRARDGHA